VTNIAFSFENSPYTHLMRKKWGDYVHYVSPVWKSAGERPLCPPSNCVLSDTNSKAMVKDFICISLQSMFFMKVIF